MLKKISNFLIAIILVTFTITNVSYAAPSDVTTIPLGPNLQDLKGKDEILKNLQNLITVRTNLISILITADSTNEELLSIDKTLSLYRESLNLIRKNLADYALLYQDSFTDILLAEQVSFIASSYIISITQQQTLIRSLQINRKNSSQLFYSNYLINVYFYLTLGDQMLAYIDSYYIFP